MSLSDLASIGSILSGLAVVVSLVYLALQVRHAEKTQRALMQQARSDRLINAAFSAMQPEIAETVTKMMTGEELSTRETLQAYYYIRMQVVTVEDAMWQHKAGFLDKDSVDTAILNLRRVMQFPACRTAWLMQRPQLSPATRARFDAILADVLSTKPDDWMEDYKEKSAEAAAMTPAPQPPTQAA